VATAHDEPVLLPGTRLVAGFMVNQESRRDRAARAAASDAPLHANEKSVPASRMPNEEKKTFRPQSS